MNTPARLLLCGLVVFIATFRASNLEAQADSTSRSWNQPVTPFRIIDNVYYVGASDVTAYLITGDAGHVLIDAGFIETAPQILANIKRLGFAPADVKIILNTHAHNDHAGGLAELLRVTKARLAVSAAEMPLLARGGKGDIHFKDAMTFPPVRATDTVSDGDTIRLGRTRLVAHLTPGHTPGCTTWTTQARQNGRTYHVVFHCSVTAPGYKLIGNADYPDIVRDYLKSFAVLQSLPCDVMLAPHGSFFDLTAKRARVGKSSTNPFIDAKECAAFFARSRRNFEALIAPRVIDKPLDSASYAQALAPYPRATATRFGAGMFRAGEAVIPYRLLEPVPFDRTRKYPLVVIFHGSAAIGTDNEAQLGGFVRSWASPEIARDFPAFVLVPQSPARTAEYEIDSFDGLLRSRGTRELDAIAGLIKDVANRYDVDRQRIYGVGFSMGASALWNVMSSQPALFAAGVPIAGIPASRRDVAALAGKPLLIVHGDADTENDIRPDRAMYDALLRAGPARAEFRQYRGLDHRVPGDMFADTVWRNWLFAHAGAPPRQ